MEAQSWALKLDQDIDSLFVYDDSLRIIKGEEILSFNGQEFIQSSLEIPDPNCSFFDGSDKQVNELIHEGYHYYSFGKNLYNSCKSAGLIHQFDSDVIAMFHDSEQNMLIATTLNGFYINDQNGVKKLFLSGLPQNLEIDQALYLDERIIYASDNLIYSWSSDDNLKRLIYQGKNQDLKISSDHFNQLWIKDGSFIFKDNQFLSLEACSLSLKKIDDLNYFIFNDSPQLFPDIDYEYKYDNHWISVKDPVIPKNELRNEVSVRAKVEDVYTDVFIFQIDQTTPSDPSKWMIYALGIMAALLLTLIILTARQFNQQQINEQRINRLRAQRQLLKTKDKLYELQMNPHFIFNSLNAIKGLVSINEPKKARRALSDFASIMRSQLNFSRSEQHDISQELHFIEKYIQLETLSHPDAFEYEIAVDPILDENQFIPPMMIQPVVENAIIHGLVPSKKKGILSIKFYEKEACVYCEVKDNGVGRSFNKVSDHSSQALQIIKDRIANENMSKELIIEDLYQESGLAAGTKVIIPLAMLS